LTFQLRGSSNFERSLYAQKVDDPLRFDAQSGGGCGRPEATPFLYTAQSEASNRFYGNFQGEVMEKEKVLIFAMTMTFSKRLKIINESTNSAGICDYVPDTE
jgi:hypothetical protein